MKYFILLFTVTVLSLTSCNKSGEDSRFSKNVNLPISPCDYITKQMIVSHFGVSKSKLELEGISNSSSNKDPQCGYYWKNENNASNSLIQSGHLGSESPISHIKIGNFRKYEDIHSAKRDFKKPYWVSSSGERNQQLTYLVDDKNHDWLEEKYHKLNNDLSGEFIRDIKLKEVYGVGDQAFYDEENKSLDVRFGTFSFSIFIETEFDTETNILIAKKLANEVWEKL